MDDPRRARRDRERTIGADFPIVRALGGVAMKHAYPVNAQWS